MHTAYEKPAYKEVPVIKNRFSFLKIFSKELVHYTFIKNYGYKEHISMVPMCSL